MQERKKPKYRLEWEPLEGGTNGDEFGIAVNDSVLDALQRGLSIDDAYIAAHEAGEALRLVSASVLTREDLIVRKRLCEIVIPVAVASTRADCLPLRDVLTIIAHAATHADAIAETILCWLKDDSRLQKSLILAERDTIIAERDTIIAELNTIKSTKGIAVNIETNNEEISKVKGEAQSQLRRAEELGREVLRLRERERVLKIELSDANTRLAAASAIPKEARLDDVLRSNDKTIESLEARLRQSDHQLRAMEQRLAATETMARDANEKLIRLQRQINGGGDIIPARQQQQQQRTVSIQEEPLLPLVPLPPIVAATVATSTRALPQERRSFNSGGGNNTNIAAATAAAAAVAADVKSRDRRCTCGWCHPKQ